MVISQHLTLHLGLRLIRSLEQRGESWHYFKTLKEA